MEPKFSLRHIAGTLYRCFVYLCLFASPLLVWFCGPVPGSAATGAYAGAVALSVLAAVLHSWTARWALRDGQYCLCWIVPIGMGVVLGACTGAAIALARSGDSMLGRQVGQYGGGFVAVWQLVYYARVALWTRSADPHERAGVLGLDLPLRVPSLLWAAALYLLSRNAEADKTFS